MGYKAGDKFVIEIKEGSIEPGLDKLKIMYHIKGFDDEMFSEEELDKMDRLDSDYVNEYFGELQDEAFNAGFDTGRKQEYEKGLKDAWELARKLLLNKEDGGMPESVWEIFGMCIYDVFQKMSPKKAMQKYEEYKKFHVGDVVSNGHDKGVVVEIREDAIRVIHKDFTTELWNIVIVKKTNKRVDLNEFSKKLEEM